MKIEHNADGSLPVDCPKTFYRVHGDFNIDCEDYTTDVEAYIRAKELNKGWSRDIYDVSTMHLVGR